MDILQHKPLLLFDFDGLLVDTERLHYRAYQKMCADRGYTLSWDFDTYCSIAHCSATGLEKQIYADFPRLYQEEPDWAVLYQEKKDAYLHCLVHDEIQMMPGATTLLQTLVEKDIMHCVVTHSSIEHVGPIRDRIPALSTIPHWFTREDYSAPKPAPDGYLLAIKKLHKDNQMIIGFEDSPRGIESLLQTPALPVIVCPKSYSQLPSVLNNPRVQHLTSLSEVH